MQSGATFGVDNVYGITCCDLNQDGFRDIVCGDANGVSNKVWLNCGVTPLAFVDSGIEMGTNSTLGIATPDPATYPTGVDGIGVNDIAAANAGSNALYLSGK